jgi:hypothetical protein
MSTGRKHPVIYEINGGSEMRDAGMYVDLKPWHCHLFQVRAS